MKVLFGKWQAGGWILKTTRIYNVLEVECLNLIKNFYKLGLPVISQRFTISSSNKIHLWKASECRIGSCFTVSLYYREFWPR